MKKPILLLAAVAFLLLGIVTVRFASQSGDAVLPRNAAPSHVEEPLAEAVLHAGGSEGVTLVNSSENPLLTSFQMTDQAGKTFDSNSLQGKVWVGSIFFSSCPSTCRVQNERVMGLQQKFAARGVEFVSVTCDPEHDTPLVLSDYARIFAAQEDKWHFLTGDMKLIQRIGNEIFRIPVKGLTHSDRLVLFNRDGSISGTFRSTDRDEVLKLSMKIDELLAVKTPATAGTTTPEAGTSTPEAGTRPEAETTVEPSA